MNKNSDMYLIGFKENKDSKFEVKPIKQLFEDLEPMFKVAKELSNKIMEYDNLSPGNDTVSLGSTTPPMITSVSGNATKNEIR